MSEHTCLEHGLAWLLLIVVFVVCVSPGVDLDDCSIRADQAVSLLFWLFGTLLLLTIQFTCAPRSQPVRPQLLGPDRPYTPMDSALLDLIGNRRI